MYRVEIYEKNSLINVALYEKLENAIYEGTHLATKIKPVARNCTLTTNVFNNHESITIKQS